MTITITHATTASDPQSPLLGASDWNAGHTISGFPRFLPRGIKAAIFGDSITNQNNTSSDPGGASFTITNESSGYFSWMNFYLGQPFYFPFAATSSSVFTSANYGISGNTTTQMLDRITDVTTYAPDVCFFMGGTNDLTAQTAAATTISKLDTIFTTLTNAGIVVVVMTILPRSDWASLNGNAPAILIARNKQNYLNHWLRTYPQRTGNKSVIICDPTEFFIDATSATGDPLSLTTREGTHPTPFGGQIIGKALANTMIAYGAFGVNRFFSQADVYDASNNPSGSVLVGGLFAGTGGTASTGVTGNVATGWTAVQSGGTGVTAVASKGSTNLSGANGTYQQLVITANGSGSGEENMYLRNSSTIVTGFSAGDTFEAGCDMEVINVTGGQLLGVALQLECANTGTTTNYNSYDMDRYSSPYYLGNVDFSGRCRTPPLVIPAVPTGLTLRINTRWQNTISGGLTLRVGNAYVRKLI